MAFDEDKYKKIFESRYGAGSFDSGLKQARDIGRLKVQADVAKQDYTARIREQQAAARKAAKAKQQAEANAPLNKWAKSVVDAFTREQQDKENIQSSNASLKATNPIKRAGTAGESYWASKGVPVGHGTTQPTPKSPDKKWVNPYTREDLKTALAQIRKAKDTGTQESFSNKFNSYASAGKDNGFSISAYDKMQNFAKKIDPSNTPAGTTRDFNEALQTKGYDKAIEDRKLDFQMNPVVSTLHDKYLQKQKQSKSSQNESTLGHILEILDRPGDAIRTGIKEKLDGHGFWQGAKDGFLGDKNTSGTELNKALGFNPDKGNIANSIAQFIARGFVGQSPDGKLYTPAVNDKIRTQIGKGTAGIASEMVLDPLNLIGSGIASKSLKGIGKLSKFAKGADAAEELLGLPSPQLRLNTPQLQLPGPKPVEPSLDALLSAAKKPNGLQNPAPSLPEVMSRALTKSQLEQQGLHFGQGSKYTPKARPDLKPIESTIDPLKRSQNYWQGRYEDFANTLKVNGYDSNNLSHDSIQELWSQFAKYDEPVNIDQVVDLAYPKGFEAPQVPKAEVPKQEDSLITALRNDPKINEKIKGFFPPARPEPKVSRPATLDELVNRIKELAPPKQAPNELPPLQFLREKGFNPNTPKNILNRGNAQPSGLDGLKNIKPGKTKA
jgi:hypothetical protein